MQVATTLKRNTLKVVQGCIRKKSGPTWPFSAAALCWCKRHLSQPLAVGAGGLPPHLLALP